MSIKTILNRFFRDEEGASAIEYALLAAMVAVAVAAFVPTINGKITDIFNKILTALT